MSLETAPPASGDLAPATAVARSLFDRVAAAPPILLVGVASITFVALALAAMWKDATVNDEIAHLPAGYTYWKTGDFRLNPEHPPLAKLIAGLPLRLMSLRWPEEEEAVHWSIGQEWVFGYRFLFLSGNDPDRIIFWGRIPMLLWGVLLIVTVYGVTRGLYGPRGSLIALVLVTFCPEILAHSHFVNTDAAVAALLFLAVVAFWKLTQRRTVVRAVLAGAALSAALTAKFSAVMLVPALAWTMVVAFVSQWQELEPSERTWKRLLKEGGLWGAYLCAVAVLAWLGIWATYGFRYAASNDPAFHWNWNFTQTKDTLIGKAIAVGRAYRLLPEAYLYGFSYMHENAQSRYAFAFGKYSDTGWWWYFPAGFLVKTPVGMILLAGAGVLQVLRRSFRQRTKEFFLLIPLITYWVLAVGSHMNIGVRHILPVYPLMIVLAGTLGVSSWDGVLKQRLILGCLALTALAGIIATPHHLAYFNLPSRLIWEPHEMLVDSSLDWGQDLGRLKAWMDENNVDQLKLSYRGNSSPRHYGLRHLQLRGSNMYTDYEREWKWAKEIVPGDLVAISATNLVGVLFDDKDFYIARFRELTPIARIGNSILIFRIPEGWSWKL